MASPCEYKTLSAGQFDSTIREETLSEEPRPRQRLWTYAS
jgi:hypothetical protein